MYPPLFEILQQDIATCLVEFLLFGAFYNVVPPTSVFYCGFCRAYVVQVPPLGGGPMFSIHGPVLFPRCNCTWFVPHRPLFSATNHLTCVFGLVSTSTIVGVPGGIVWIRSPTIEGEIPRGFEWDEKRCRTKSVHRNCESGRTHHRHLHVSA